MSEKGKRIRMKRKKIEPVDKQRPFTVIYHDFLESSLLNTYEKMVFIVLKRFSDNKNQCFPSLKKIADITQISRRKIQDTLKTLEQKHVISVETRFDADSRQTSNLYILHDHAETWHSENDENAKTDETAEMKLIAELQSMGYTVTKEKEPDSEPPKVQNQTKNNQYDVYDYTTKLKESQVPERYTLEQIHQFFSYDVMVSDNPDRQCDIDYVMNIIYATVNTAKPTIRISREDKPVMTVISRLMNLNKETILYVIEKFSKQTGRIDKPKSYMLTMLYHAPEQYP